HAPRAQQPAPAADLVLAQVALEYECAFAHPVVPAQLLGNPVQVHRIGGTHVAWQSHLGSPGLRHRPLIMHPHARVPPGQARTRAPRIPRIPPALARTLTVTWPRTALT